MRQSILLDRCGDSRQGKKNKHYSFGKTVITSVLTLGAVVALTSFDAFAESNDNDSARQDTANTAFSTVLGKASANNAAISIAPEEILNTVNLTNEALRKNNLLNRLSINTASVEPAGVYVDGKLEFVTSKSQALYAAFNAVLDETLSGIKTYSENDRIFFANNIQVRYGAPLVGEVLDNHDVYSAVKELILQIGVKTNAITTEDIDFEKQTKEVDTEYVDYKEITQKGVKGSKQIESEVLYIDNRLIKNDVLSTKILREPISEIEVVGTMEKTEQSGAEASGTEATGTYLWPVPSTTNITSYFEPRWGSFHYGIDISGGGCYGADIVASDAGVVTFSGDKGCGYGYHVIIDHGNGRETLYAHASALYVSEGESVAQGQTIAAIGSTGFSTGPHLHFEVRIDGEKLDPLSFL